MYELYAPIPVLAAAILSLTLEKRSAWIKYVALAGSAASLLISVYSIFVAPQTTAITWFSYGQIAFTFQTAAAHINLLLLLLVNAVNPLIIIYSMGFIESPSEQSRYYFLLSIFAVSMMLFAISGSLPTTILAWEMLGITSYLLIGFWYSKPEATAAARKAMTMMVIGDCSLLAAVVVIAVSYHTLIISSINLLQPTPALYLALSLVLVAAFTKSAQLPFSEWLSDAMEGPTPVSAFLHSSTMVKAGVFLIAILLPIFISAKMLPVILAVGLATALYGSLNALTERHIKKVLAYSTMEEMGLMLVALGLGSIPAAMMLFLMQTFYKALLFMGSGAIMKANSEETDISSMYGSSSRKNMIIITTIIGAISLAAIFPLSGFFGKYAVSYAAYGTFYYPVILAIGLISSFYIFRWIGFLSRKPTGKNKTKIELEYKTIPQAMVYSQYAMAALVIFAALLFTHLPTYLGSAPIALKPTEIILETAAALAGLAIAYIVYRKWAAKSLSGAKLNRPYLGNALNSGYSGVVIAAQTASKVSNRIEIAMNKGVSYAFGFLIATGKLVGKMEDGKPNTYMIAFLIGLAVIILIFVT